MKKFTRHRIPQILQRRFRALETFSFHLFLCSSLGRNAPLLYWYLHNHFLFHAKTSSVRNFCTKKENNLCTTMTSCERGDCSSLSHCGTKQLNHKQKTTSRFIARLPFLPLTKPDSLQSSSGKTIN